MVQDDLGLSLGDLAAMGLDPADIRRLLQVLAGEAGVGSIAGPLPAVESPLPVDVIVAEDFGVGGPASRLGGDLARSMESLTAVGPGPQRGAVFFPVSRLRGFGPDHAVLLVDGRRRARSLAPLSRDGALVALAVIPDAGALPEAAFRQAEVLRAGASALYGSGAGAGAVNLALRDSVSAGRVELRSGGLLRSPAGSAGARPAYSLAAQAGVPFGSAGFANLAFESAARPIAVSSSSSGEAFALRLSDDAKILGHVGGALPGTAGWRVVAAIGSRRLFPGAGFLRGSESDLFRVDDTSVQFSTSGFIGGGAVRWDAWASHGLSVLRSGVPSPPADRGVRHADSGAGLDLLYYVAPFAVVAGGFDFGWEAADASSAQRQAWRLAPSLKPRPRVSGRLSLELHDPGPEGRWTAASTVRVTRYADLGLHVDQLVSGRYAAHRWGRSFLAFRASFSQDHLAPSVLEFDAFASSLAPSGRRVEGVVSGGTGVVVDSPFVAAQLDWFAASVRDRRTVLSDTSLRGVDWSVTLRPGGRAGADVVRAGFARVAPLSGDSRYRGVAFAFPLAGSLASRAWLLSWRRAAGRFDYRVRFSEASDSLQALDFLVDGGPNLETEIGFSPVRGLRLVGGLGGIGRDDRPLVDYSSYPVPGSYWHLGLDFFWGG